MNGIAEKKNGLFETVVRVRRALHACPELSSKEFKTSAFLAAELSALGYAVKKTHTGLTADVVGCEGKRTLAFRADFDALPIAERTGLPFASTNGNMHACGHDGHAAMLLGAATYFASHPPKNNIRLIFQFGEEGDGGAETMIRGGALAGIDRIFAFHLCPELDFGKVGTNDGTLFAGVVEHDVRFRGKSAHCAVKESEGADALAAAVRFASTADGCREERANTLYHVGKLVGGRARNIVADDACLECSLRFFSEKDRDAILDNLRASVRDVAAAFGAEGELTVKSAYPPLVNDPSSVAELARVTDLVTVPGRYTAEDFAFYLKQTKGCMAWLGVRDGAHTSPLHSDTFDYDEHVLMFGTELWIKLADLS